jgi:hypothetical protein
MNFLLFLIISELLNNSIYSLQPFINLYSYSSDNKGPYFYRQENGMRIEGFNRYLFNKATSISFAGCLYRCTSTPTCYMGFYNMLDRQCSMFNFVSLDSNLVNDVNSITFFKGSENLNCV